MTQDLPISHWDRTAEEPYTDTPLDGDAKADLVIVGGGFTGLSAALHAAERGIDTLVLEAAEIGYGGSGRNVGLVNAGLWLPPQDVRAQLGEMQGARLVSVLGAAPDAVFSLIERHQIRCEAVRNGTIHAAHAPSGMAELERRHNEWRRLGAPVELLSADKTKALAGTAQFRGGLLDRRAGTINPMGYVRGLARAARAAGARIATQTLVDHLKQTAAGWEVRTPRGTAQAKTVVLATNAYTDRLWPGLRQSFVPIHYFQLSTAPMGQLAVDILPGGHGLWDTGKIMTSLRRDRDGRLLIGSMGKCVGGTTGLSARWASATLRRMFPDLGPVRFEAAWDGRIAMTPDHLPRIHKLADGLYTPIGYNGRGIGPGTVFGKAMADLVADGREDALPLPISKPKPIQSARVQALFYQAAFTANQVWRSI